MIKCFKISFLLSIVFLVGCGTGTGNPFEPKNGLPSNGATDSEFSHNGLNNIVIEYCNLLTQCFTSLTQNNCSNTFLSRTDLTPYFNLPEFENLNLAIFAEKNHVFNISTASSQKCIQSIKALQCSDSQVRNAYIVDQIDSWSLLHQLITPSCFLEIQLIN